MLKTERNKEIDQYIAGNEMLKTERNRDRPIHNLKRDAQNREK